MNEWISVKDRLPDNDTEVLAWVSGVGCFIEYISSASEDDQDGWTQERFTKSFDFWMPLPEPPEVE